MEAMVAGYPANAQRGHHTLEGCIREWQLHCALGVHPHPVDPALHSPAAGTRTAVRTEARAIEDKELQARL